MPLKFRGFNFQLQQVIDSGRIPDVEFRYQGTLEGDYSEFFITLLICFSEISVQEVLFGKYCLIRPLSILVEPWLPSSIRIRQIKLATRLLAML